MIENEMTVSVPLEVVKASEIEPKEVKWLLSGGWRRAAFHSRSQTAFGQYTGRKAAAVGVR